MAEFVLSQDPRYMRFVEERTAHIDGIEVFDRANTWCCVHLGKRGEIIGVVAFSDWHVNYVEASIASDGTARWATRRFLAYCYGYALDYADKLRMNMVTAADNHPAINMHKALGHVQEGQLRDWFGPGRDALIFGFTKQDWKRSRWNPANQRKGDNKNGQKLTSTSTTST